MYTITSYGFFSGSQLPSTHFQKKSGIRQLQVVEGSQLPSTPFHKNLKIRQLKVAPGSQPPSDQFLELLMKMQRQIASCFRQSSFNNTFRQNLCLGCNFQRILLMISSNNLQLLPSSNHCNISIMRFHAKQKKQTQSWKKTLPSLQVF